MDISKNTRDLFQKGLHRVKEGDAEKATRLWKECIQIDPGYLEPYGHLAWLYLSQKNFQQAEILYMKLLEKDPANAEAHFCLALSLLYTNPVKARINYKKALSLAGNNKQDYPVHWKKLWEEHRKKSGGFLNEKYISALVHKNKLLKSAELAFRWVCYEITLAVLTVYHLFVRKIVLPKFAAQKTSKNFSIIKYLRFLSKYVYGAGRFNPEYSRVIEAELHSEVVGLKAGAKVVDVGTGKNPLPLYWAKQGMRVVCTDPDDFVLNLKSLAKKIGLQHMLDSGNLSVEVCRGDKLPFENNTFDFWTSVSVIEHIPEDGDMLVMKEAGRVLKPGGIAVLTVEGGPNEEIFWYRVDGYFGMQYRDHVSSDDLERMGLSDTTHPQGTPESPPDESFAMLREYNKEKLLERLVKPSGLQLIEMGMIDNRFKTDFRGLVDLPNQPWWRIFLRLFLPLVVYWSYRRSPDHSDKPTHSATAYVILQKPDEVHFA